MKKDRREEENHEAVVLNVYGIIILEIKHKKRNIQDIIYIA